MDQEKKTVSDDTLCIEDRYKIENRHSSHDSSRKKTFLILCERCGQRPARISCRMCCSNQLCIQCSHHLHSSQTRKRHTPIFLPEKRNNNDAIAAKREETTTTIGNSTLTDICNDALLSMKMIVQRKKSTDLKVNELQKIRQEKRIQETIRKNEEKELRTKEAIRNTTVLERNKATIINRFSRLFIDKIRYRKRQESLHYFIEVCQLLFSIHLFFKFQSFQIFHYTISLVL